LLLLLLLPLSAQHSTATAVIGTNFPTSSCFQLLRLLAMDGKTLHTEILELLLLTF